MAELRKFDIKKMTKSELAAYIDREAQPFIELNNKAVAAGRQAPFVNPHLEAIRYELVKREDGSIVKKERDEPLLTEVGEVSNQWLTDVRIKKFDGEKVLAQTRPSGKYGDEHRLIPGEALSVEPHEFGGNGIND